MTMYKLQAYRGDVDLTLEVIVSEKPKACWHLYAVTAKDEECCVATIWADNDTTAAERDALALWLHEMFASRGGVHS